MTTMRTNCDGNHNFTNYITKRKHCVHSDDSDFNNMTIILTRKGQHNLKKGKKLTLKFRVGG